MSSFQLSAENVREECESHRILQDFCLFFSMNLKYTSVLPRTVSDSYSLLNPAGGRIRRDRSSFDYDEPEMVFSLSSNIDFPCLKSVSKRLNLSVKNTKGKRRDITVVGPLKLTCKRFSFRNHTKIF